MPASPLGDVTVAVLAGGFGTRLRPVVSDRPKVVAAVQGRPFLAFILDHLAAAGCHRVVLLCGYRAEQVRAAFGARHAGMQLVYSVEPEPLGTGGAIRHAWSHFTDPLGLVVNGDSFCGVSFSTLRLFHDRSASNVTLVLTRVENAGRYGRVSIDDDDTIRQFEEKRPDTAAGWINAGIYLLPRDLIAGLPADRPLSLEREVFPRWAALGLLRGHRTDAPFIDIGLPETYREAGAFFEANTAAAERVPC